MFLGIIAAAFLGPLWIYDSVVTPTVYEPMIPVRQNADGTENAIPYPLNFSTRTTRIFTTKSDRSDYKSIIEHLNVYFTKGLLSGAYGANKRIVTQNYYPQNWVLPLPTDTENDEVWYWKNADPFDEL